MTSYAELLKDPRWQKKKAEVLERADYECESCGDKTKTLHAHHRHYEFGKEPWEYMPDDYLCLCEDCHSELTKATRLVKRALGRLNSGDFQRACGYIYGLHLLDEPDYCVDNIDYEFAEGLADACEDGRQNSRHTQRTEALLRLASNGLSIDGWKLHEFFGV